VNKDYELLETYTNEKGDWSYLRHKKTGLEIAYNKCVPDKSETPDPPETGFSFCFKTPVEDPYLGTTHVLEHCVMCGSQKYKVHFFDLLDFSCWTDFNAETTERHTRFFYYSILEEESFKFIPILADYVFFPELLEITFLQECMRVRFSADGDGRKNEIIGVVYNEMKNNNESDGTLCGGLDYRLHELTVEKIREYHKKYYRPDNCLFSFSGTASLNTVLSLVDKIIPDLEKGFSACKITPRKTLTIKEFLEKAPFKQAPKNLKNPGDARWFDEESKEDICSYFEDYWNDEVSPLMPYCLDEKYAYSAVCWYRKNHKEKKEPPLPPRKPVQKIIKEYLAKIDVDEYRKKLESLNEWQARDNRVAAQKIMEPIAVNENDVRFTKSEEEIQKWLERLYGHDKSSKRKSRVVIEIDKHYCNIQFLFTEETGHSYYADYLLVLFLKRYFSIQLREKGKVYCININYDIPCNFSIDAVSTNRPKKTIDFIKEHIKKIATYNFDETDILILKSLMYTRAFIPQLKTPEMSNEVFNVTPEDLHQAALRFKRLVVKYERDEPARIAREEKIKKLRVEARRERRQ
jgi:hypothetical protein